MAPAGVGPVLPAAAYTATPFRGRVFPATYERVDAPAASHRRWPTYEVIVLTAPFPLDLRDLDEAFASVPWTGVNRDLAAAVAMRLETEGRRVSWAWFPVPATGRKDRRS